MSDYIVIHGELTGDWALVFSESYKREPISCTLFRPRDWSWYRSIGLSYYPLGGISLSSNPKRAHRQAKRIVEKEERIERGKLRKLQRQKKMIEELEGQ